MQSVPSDHAARHRLRPGYAVAPMALAINTPCVLASEQASRPDDERHSAKPS